jgi:hypothetical protein
MDTAAPVRRSLAWTVVFRAAYALLRLLDPFVRWGWAHGGIGITSRLTVIGRRSGRDRSVLVGLLRVGGGLYVGHPNGEVDWTANLRSSLRARVAPAPDQQMEVTASPLTDGPERTAVILATARQQPFPGNLLYRAGRRHILAAGRYFRLEAEAGTSPPTSAEAIAKASRTKTK